MGTRADFNEGQPGGCLPSTTWKSRQSPRWFLGQTAVTHGLSGFCRTDFSVNPPNTVLGCHAASASRYLSLEGGTGLPFVWVFFCNFISSRQMRADTMMLARPQRQRPPVPFVASIASTSGDALGWWSTSRSTGDWCVPSLLPTILIETRFASPNHLPKSPFQGFTPYVVVGM